MTLALILTVGEDLALLESRAAILRSAGYAVETELSVRRAMQRFIDGDFDLVLLCHSISPEDRGRLISTIRATGSRTPIIFVAALESQVPDALADATVDNAPMELLRGIEEVLLTVGKRSVRRESRFSSLVRCELPIDPSAIAAETKSPEHTLPTDAGADGFVQNRKSGARRNPAIKQPEKTTGFDCKGPDEEYGRESARMPHSASAARSVRLPVPWPHTH